MDEIDDRRGSDRVYIMTTVKLAIDGETVEATALDLSVSGVSVWAPEVRAPAGALGIEMVIDAAGPLRLTGKLARQFESDGGSVWGIAFDGVDAGTLQRLERYLATL